MSVSRRLDALLAAGVGFVAGVPCSYLKTFFAGCRELPLSSFLPAVREDHAVAACAGAWLGGTRAAAAMQNSGSATASRSSPRCTSCTASRCRCWSPTGADPSDYEEHRILGQRTRQLLDLFAIPGREARPGAEGDDASWLVAASERERRPAVLLVGQGADS